MRIFEKRKVVIDGYYPEKGGEKDSMGVDLSGFFLPPCYKRAVKRFTVDDLFVSDMKRFRGWILNATEYTGVMLIDGPLDPFFITSEQVEKLVSLRQLNQNVAEETHI